MKPLQRFYLRLILFTSIPYLILMVLISLLMDGKIDIVPNLLGGALFGTLMSFFFVSVQKESLKRVGVEEWTDKNLQTHQQN